MPDFAVSIAIRGDDQVSNDLRRISARVDRFGRNADRSFRLASKAAGMFKSVLMGTLAAGAISKGFSALNVGIGATLRGFADMDHALTSAGAKFQLAKLGVEGAAQAMERLKNAARETGATTEFTSAEAAQGLEFLAMAGFSAEQAIASLPAMVDLATSTSTDFARASDIASDALGAFGLASKDATIQAANLNRVSDVFSTTTASANVDMENLFNTMKESAPIMTSAGQSLESFAALTAIMGNAGIKGSKAGTTMKNAITSLVDPVGRGKKEIARLGIQVQDSAGNMRSMAEVLQDLAKATDNMGTAQKSAVVSAIFGKEALSGMTAALEEGVPTLEAFKEQLKNSTSNTKRMAETMRSSLTNRLKILQSTLLALGTRIVDAFQDKFPGAIDAAIEAVKAFDVTPIIDGIKGVVGFITSAIDVIYRWRYAILLLVGAFAIFKIAMALTATFELFIALVTGATTISKAWAASQWAVNAAMYANPITWIIALIGALIAIIVLVIVYWDELVAGWQAGLDSIWNGTNETANWIAEKLAWMATPAVNASIAIANAFGEAWHSLKSGLASTVSFAISAWRKLKSSLGLDVSGIPSEGDVAKWFGTDKEYQPIANVTEEQMAKGYKGFFRDAAAALGADTTGPGGEKVEPPNRARVEAQMQSVDVRGQIDIFSPEGYQTQMTSSNTTVNGKKTNAVDWKQRGGRNSGK